MTKLLLPHKYPNRINVQLAVQSNTVRGRTACTGPDDEGKNDVLSKMDANNGLFLFCCIISSSKLQSINFLSHLELEMS